MPDKVYIVVGNHRSLVGINEIIYTISSALSENFSVEIITRLKQNSVNVLIDEFSSPAYVAAIDETKKRHPNTKIVVVATEFVTPVRVFGADLMKTFNFFGAPRDWITLLVGALRAPIGGMPSYMRMRYLGFVSALEHCDLLTSVQPAILGTLSELRTVTSHLGSPLMVYPRIGALPTLQQDRLDELPAGFTMTGTLTSYRSQIARNLIKTFRYAGWFAPIYQHVPFEAPAASIFSTGKEEADSSSSAASIHDYLHAQYDTITPSYLFNINPPQTSEWPYSSPMRILRAILLGQIPVVTKLFHDHMIEDVAMLWDDKFRSALKFGSYQLGDRQGFISDYLSSVAAYDQKAREANEPFVQAMTALCGGRASGRVVVNAREGSALRRAG
jgi:hypothetical protein